MKREINTRQYYGVTKLSDKDRQYYDQKIKTDNL